MEHMKSYVVDRHDDDYDPWDGVLIASFFKCPECSSPSIGITGVNQPSDREIGIAVKGEQAVWLPQHADGKDFPDVPEQVALAADEAHRCLSINAFRAAVLMARSVVEATCKDKGITQGKLDQKINALRDQQDIRPGTADMAHEIRYFGNEMAHGDFVVEVDREEAEDTLELMGQILNEVYQGPALVARTKANRAARKAAATNATTED